jgi:hypothetical protein
MNTKEDVRQRREEMEKEERSEQRGSYLLQRD